jgi:hypothetical protein
VADYRRQLDDTFLQAHKELEKESLKVAKELVDCATNKSVKARDRITAGFGIMDRIGIKRGQTTKPGGGPGRQEVMFEQTLRMVKRTMEGEPEEIDEETQAALKQLEELEPEGPIEADFEEVQE